MNVYKVKFESDAVRYYYASSIHDLCNRLEKRGCGACEIVSVRLILRPRAEIVPYIVKLEK